MTRLRFPEKASSNYWRAFLYGIGISLVFFLPFIIWDNGYFLFYGDFNVQQVPFYQMCHDAIRSGNIGWSWTTDLGANFIGSYTFYLLGSPFFWLTLPFPSEAVPYLMGPLLILKFGCASLTGFIYLKPVSYTHLKSPKRPVFLRPFISHPDGRRGKCARTSPALCKGRRFKIYFMLAYFSEACQEKGACVVRTKVPP